MKKQLFVCAALLLLGATAQAQRTTSDQRGLLSLSSNGRNFIVLDDESQGFRVRGATLQNADGSAAEFDGKSLTRWYNVEYNQISLHNADLHVTYRFRPGGGGRLAVDSLMFEAVIQNLGDKTIRGIDLQLATLRFPSTPANFNGDPRLNPNRDAPALIEAPSADPKDDWQVLVENQTPARPLIWGFPYSTDKPANRTYPLIISTRGVNWLGNLLDPYIDRPLLPGATERIKIVLHFGTRAEIAKVRAQVLADYARQFPPLLKWDDRRAIGMAVLSTSSEAHHSKTNPRGWFNDPNFNAFDSVSFKRRVLDYARSVVLNSKAINAQGVIVWDLEGQEFPHATSYLGDPRSLPPEMEAVADEFFQTLRDGGLKVGLCVRPQRPVRAAYGGEVQQIESENPAQTLIDKIGYARKRWGATMFYVDSNGDPNVPFPAQIFEQVLAAHPDILLIPEHQSARYYRFGAPYEELRGGISSTPSEIRELYPRAFSVIALSDGDTKARRAELVRAVQAGDVLMSRVWFDDSFNQDVKSIYDEASQAKGTPPR